MPMQMRIATCTGNENSKQQTLQQHTLQQQQQQQLQLRLAPIWRLLKIRQGHYEIMKMFAEIEMEIEVNTT